MWGLIPTKDKRKYRIVETLFAAKEPVTIRQLAEQTGASVRIIKYDLDEISESLCGIAGSIVTSSDGVSLTLPASIGMDFFQRGLYSEAMSLRFLEIIFFDETLGYEDIMEQLYLSESSLRRMVQNIQRALKAYGIALETQPFRVVGHETLIRNFYTTYFEEKYTLYDWPFENVNLEFMEAIISIGFRYFEMPETAMEYHHYHFLFGVDLTRGLNGHPAPNIHAIPDDFREQQYADFLDLMMEPIAKLQIDDTTARRYFNEMIDWGMFMSVPYLLERMKNDVSLQLEIERTQARIQQLARVFDLPEVTHHFLILQLHSMIDFYRLFPPGQIGKKYLLFPTFNSRYNDKMKKMLPLFYAEAEKMLIAICSERGIFLGEDEQDDLDYLMYILLSRWSQLNVALMKKFNSCRILVSSHQSFKHSEDIATLLRTELSRYDTISIFQGKRLSPERLEGYHFDLLVVTNTPNLEIPQPVLYMNERAMDDRLYLLRQMTDAIVEKNKHAYIKSVKERMRRAYV